MSDFLDAGRHFASPKFRLFEAEREFFNTHRWDEKAGLRTGCCTLPSYRRAQGTDKKETGNEEG